MNAMEITGINPRNKKGKLVPWLPRISTVNEEEETGVVNPNITTQFSDSNKFPSLPIL